MPARFAAATRDHPCSRPRRLNGYGFLIGWRVDADALGAAAGVAVGGVVAGRGQAVARGSGGAGCAAVRSGVAVAAGRALASGVRADRTGGVDGGPADDRDGNVRVLDGAQAALPVGLQVLGGGGVGLDPSASLLPDLALGAGAGRVDGPQAHQADRVRDRRGADARVDRDRGPGEALPAAGGQDRFDGDRGRCEVSDRRGARRQRGRRVGARGPQAGDVDRRAHGASMGRKLRAITRTIRRRSGEAKTEVIGLTAQTGELLERSVKEARRLAVVARRKARGRGAQRKLQAAAGLEELADRCQKVARQIRQRVAGEPTQDRIVSLFDPDARPIRTGKLGKPNEFGFVSQLAEVTEHTQRGARGLILPASTALGTPAEDTLLPGTVAELQRLAISVREVAVDAGFNIAPTNTALADCQPTNVFIAGRQEPGSKRTQRRLRRHRTGAEGRISHLKRRYGLDRSRLKGDQGRQIWTEWAILAYNTDTLAIRAR